MIEIKDKTGKALTNAEVAEKVINRGLNIILDFKLMVLRWVGHIPIHTFRKICYQIAGVKIGNGSTIHMWCNFFNPSGIMIGEDSVIGNNAFLDGRASLKIGNHVAISSEVLIYNSEHDVHDENMTAIEEPVEIEDYAFIGPRVIILPGKKIGRGAVVAAGAVVTHDVEPGKIVGGVPAHTIGERKTDDLHYKLGRTRLFQ
jgi:acetyltransferase-like isoleucine patch superfamily enzyme